MASDDRYLKLLLAPMKECAKYKPAFGQEGDEGVSVAQFRKLYGADPLYRWVGLDSDLMYAAHKAAGGMTSVYRQLGIGCERLLREVVKDSCSLSDEQVKWSYRYEKEDGKQGTHTLDARIDATMLQKPKADAVRAWLRSVAKSKMLLPADRAKALKGIVMEVRQGYKSADSKRQNADLRFGVRAYNEQYLPAIVIVSTQVSVPVCRRYQAAQMLVLIGNDGPADVSTFRFFRDVVGYDVAGFFERNSPKLRKEVANILEGLLTPD